MLVRRTAHRRSRLVAAPLTSSADACLGVEFVRRCTSTGSNGVLGYAAEIRQGEIVSKAACQVNQVSLPVPQWRARCRSRDTPVLFAAQVAEDVGVPLRGVDVGTYVGKKENCKTGLLAGNCGSGWPKPPRQGVAGCFEDWT